MTALIALLVSLTGLVSANEDLLVPAEAQWPILRNVWSYDRSFPRDRAARVAILYQEKYRRSQSVKEELMASALATPAAAQMIPVNLRPEISIADQLPEGVDVVYVTPMRAVDVAAITRATRTRRVRTVTPVADYVMSGIALGIVVEQDRPRIMINLQAANAEGADYSAQLLKLVRLVR
jgi:hypothetical protein